MKFKKNASGIRFTKHLPKVQTPLKSCLKFLKNLLHILLEILMKPLTGLESWIKNTILQMRIIVLTILLKI